MHYNMLILLPPPPPSTMSELHAIMERRRKLVDVVIDVMAQKNTARNGIEEELNGGIVPCGTGRTHEPNNYDVNAVHEPGRAHLAVPVSDSLQCDSLKELISDLPAARGATLLEGLDSRTPTDNLDAILEARRRRAEQGVLEACKSDETVPHPSKTCNNDCGDVLPMVETEGVLGADESDESVPLASATHNKYRGAALSMVKREGVMEVYTSKENAPQASNTCSNEHSAVVPMVITSIKRETDAESSADESQTTTDPAVTESDASLNDEVAAVYEDDQAKLSLHGTHHQESTANAVDCNESLARKSEHDTVTDCCEDSTSWDPSEEADTAHSSFSSFDDFRDDLDLPATPNVLQNSNIAVKETPYEAQQYDTTGKHWSLIKSTFLAPKALDTICKSPARLHDRRRSTILLDDLDNEDDEDDGQRQEGQESEPSPKSVDKLSTEQNTINVAEIASRVSTYEKTRTKHRSSGTNDRHSRRSSSSSTQDVSQRKSDRSTASSSRSRSSAKDTSSDQCVSTRSSSERGTESSTRRRHKDAAASPDNKGRDVSSRSRHRTSMREKTEKDTSARPHRRAPASGSSSSPTDQDTKAQTKDRQFKRAPSMEASCPSFAVNEKGTTERTVEDAASPDASAQSSAPDENGSHRTDKKRGSSSRSLLHKSGEKGSSSKSLLHKSGEKGSSSRSLLHKSGEKGSSSRSLLHKSGEKSSSSRSLLRKSGETIGDSHRASKPKGTKSRLCGKADLESETEIHNRQDGEVTDCNVSFQGQKDVADDRRVNISSNVDDKASPGHRPKPDTHPERRDRTNSVRESRPSSSRTKASTETIPDVQDSSSRLDVSCHSQIAKERSRNKSEATTSRPTLISKEAPTRPSITKKQASSRKLLKELQSRSFLDILMERSEELKKKNGPVVEFDGHGSFDTLMMEPSRRHPTFASSFDSRHASCSAMAYDLQVASDHKPKKKTGKASVSTLLAKPVNGGRHKRRGSTGTINDY